MVVALGTSTLSWQMAVVSYKPVNCISSQENWKIKTPLFLGKKIVRHDRSCMVFSCSIFVLSNVETPPLADHPLVRGRVCWGVLLCGAI